MFLKVGYGGLVTQQSGDGAGSDPRVGHLVPLLLGGDGQVEGVVLLALVVLLILAGLTIAGVQGHHRRLG